MLDTRGSTVDITELKCWSNIPLTVDCGATHGLVQECLIPMPWSEDIFI